MNTDSYYEIGSGHIYCQDYARVGTIKIGEADCPYIVVSDGCSSSKDSDLGARFWAQKFPEIVKHLAIYEHLAIHENIDAPIEKIFLDHLVLQSPEICNERYDATIVGALYDPNTDIFYSVIIGDGKIIYHGKDFNYVESLSFKSNAPYYPTYHIDQERAKGYDQAFGTEYGTLSIKTYREKEFLLQESYFKKMLVNRISNYSQMEYLGVTVTTDGLDTFYKKDDKSAVPFSQVLKEVSSFKMLQGKFVERRMLGFKKFCRQNGIEHYDDIAAASMMK